MRWGDVGGAAFLVVVIGTVIFMGHRTKSSQQPLPAETVPADVGFGTFCGRAHLVPKAHDDCQKAMAAATTDADRLAIERRFAMGSVKLDEPAPPQP